MKKKLINLLLVLCMAFAVMGFVGCDKNSHDNPQSTTDSTTSPTSEDLSSSDDDSSEIPPPSTSGDSSSNDDSSSEDSIPPTSGQPPKKENFTGITFPDKTVTYNGNPHRLELVGVPTFATVNYDKETSYTNAGIYTVKATVTADNYNALELSATLTIDKDTYDMSSVTYTGTTVIYDGQPHTITVVNLPDGVTASVEQKSCVNADSYDLIVTFTGDSANYNPIDSVTKTLTINKATVEQISFNGEICTYDGRGKSLAIKSELPDEVSVRYENNNQVNAGEYTVTARFTVSDNYNAIPDKTATLTIEKKELTVMFGGETELTYTGEVQKTISATPTNLVDGDSVQITLTYSGEMIEKGDYTVTANIDEKNYKLTQNNTVVVKISRAAHTLTFKQEGFVDVTLTVNDLENITARIPAPQAATGYDIKWVWGDNDYTRVTDSWTITAQKTAIAYPIFYTLNGGNTSNPVSYTIEDRITLAEPTKTGYTFLGWTGTDLTEEAHEVFFENATGAREYIASWEASKYMLSFDSQGCEEIADKQVTYQESYGELPLPTKKGYTFIGWYDSLTGGNKITSATIMKIPEDSTLYTRWKSDVRYTLEGDHYKVTGLNNLLTSEIIIESYYNDLPVTEIGDSAFFNATNLTSVVIPDSITWIGTSAFGYCNRLTSVLLPQNVVLSSYGVFYNCRNLASITVAENNVNYKSIEGNLYSKDGTTILQYAIGKNASKFEIPDGVTSIRDNVFYGCSSLTSIVLPDSVAWISEHAFDGCGNLANIVTAESNTRYKSIDGNLYNKSGEVLILYAGGKKEREFEVPDGVISIEPYAFSMCSSLENVIVPDSVAVIGKRAFYDCSSLITINIPEGITFIGGFAFYNCSNLISLDIPDSVISIDEGAFCGCSSLASITIGSGVTTLEEYAQFSYCYSLTNITVAENNINYQSIDGNLYSKDGRNLILYAIGKTASIFDIPNHVTSIGTSAFANCRNLTSVVIPKNVTEIKSGAFDYCENLLEIINKSSLPIAINSVDYGGVARYAKQVVNNEEESKLLKENDYIFYNDNGTYYLLGYAGIATDLVLPDGIDGYDYAIYRYAFHNRSTLTSVVIPDCVISIEYAAFDGCHNLTSVTFGENSRLISLGDFAFSNCSALTSITIPDRVTSIGNSSFSNCSSLTNMVIPDSITKIGMQTFYNCSSLTSVIIGNGVTSITYTMFFKCSNLTNVVIGNNVTSIAMSAFEDCSSLTSIVIPVSVTRISENTFSGCSSLTNVTFDNTSGWNVFTSSSTKIDITIENPSINASSLTAIYAYCDYIWTRG